MRSPVAMSHSLLSFQCLAVPFFLFFFLHLPRSCFVPSCGENLHRISEASQARGRISQTAWCSFTQVCRNHPSAGIVWTVLVISISPQQCRVSPRRKGYCSGQGSPWQVNAVVGIHLLKHPQSRKWIHCANFQELTFQLFLILIN